ncbi:hypothetical protein [Desulfonatronum thioautotrophicum]|uniref:hypothetical protein n=1 Tax=Desulfonatronum thioautotrophicum TaxID=617001 RepID=UPI0005EB686D|nr:hypothetical protein [Desulfonatronum thioautotrophicum]
MELGSAAQSQAGVAMMAQTLQNATMGVDVVTKTLGAASQVNAGAGGGEANADIRAVAEATGKGLKINATV